MAEPEDRDTLKACLGNLWFTNLAVLHFATDGYGL